MTKFVTLTKWDFRNKQDFSDEISAEENEVFPTDIKIDWYKYWISLAFGLRLYILKENPATLPKARTQHKM
jgi:hypothetical protein